MSRTYVNEVCRFQGLCANKEGDGVSVSCDWGQSPALQLYVNHNKQNKQIE